MSGWSRSSGAAGRGVHRLARSCLAALAACLLVGCTRRDPAPGPGTAPAQVLRLSQRNEPGTLDATLATLPDEFGILRSLSEGLLVPGAGGEPQPGVATRYDVSPDGLTYTFHLRPDARWSDGGPVTAADFVATYRRALTPGTGAPKANVFHLVRNAEAFVAARISDFSAVGFRAAGPHTLEVTLGQPSPRFPYYVVSGPWLPVPLRVIEQHGRNWTRPGHFVGNGPFQLAEWRPDQHLLVRKNPHWHGADRVRLDAIEFVRFDSGDTEDRAYRVGQVDATMAIPFSKLETHLRERPAEVHRAPMNETRYFSFNTRRAPLDNPAIRRALSLAVDRQKIVDLVLKGGQQPATRLVPPGLRDSTVPAPEFARAEHRHDPAAARQLLASAGVNVGELPRLEVSAWSPSQTPVLEAAQQMWREELGLEVTIAIREARVHLAALTAGDYDIAFITAIPDVADSAQLLGDFTTASPENYPQWRDASFDQAFERARSAGAPEARATAMLAAERLLLEAAVVAPVYFNTKIWLMSPRVQGWQEDGLWSRCYHQIRLAPP